ncbi:4Fe-4S cluster-binding domain-containing protein [Spiroplasma clarkii]|uniref:4Fe-4S cluster-binding domain-containing protein n=1 Tax=Spiroplasma clarkii TaxID=2139 RepID=UPI0011BAC74B|nr:4Fe-4S cluster-binding domain-containing protein [Spiroplasma clarkii]
MEQPIGYYSSIETFGAVDGPGVRLVIFLQGCYLRCKYCHNPETLEFKRDKPITVDEVIRLYQKINHFIVMVELLYLGEKLLLKLIFVLHFLKRLSH